MIFSKRRTRLSKSAGHFRRMAGRRRAASSPRVVRPPPGPSETPRLRARGSKYRSLTETSERTSAQDQSVGRSRPARVQGSSGSHALSAPDHGAGGGGG